MTISPPVAAPPDLATRLRETRAATEALAAPLAPEDQVVQSMPDVSPTKWHRAHTTWFFETFVLGPHLPGYRPVDPGYDYLFNSYYEQVGPRHPRAERGLISRPTVAEVGAYRAAVDDALGVAASTAPPDERWDDVGPLVELGIHHEQQHQELLLMDIKHVLSRNPLRPAYADGDGHAHRGRRRAGRGWIDARRRHRSSRPRRRRLRVRQRGPPPRRAAAPVPHRRPARHLRRVAGLHGRRRLRAARAVAVRRLGHRAGSRAGEAPLYWEPDGDGWAVFTLAGLRPVDPAEPVVPRQLLRGRRLRPLGRRPAADRGRVGGGRPAPSASARRRPTSHELHLHPTGRAGARPASARPSARCGSGPPPPTCPTPASSPPPARSVSTTASSCATRWCCGAAACVTPPGHARTDLPQLLPAGRPLGLRRPPPRRRRLSGPPARAPGSEPPCLLSCPSPSTSTSDPTTWPRRSAPTCAAGLTADAEVAAAEVVLRRPRQRAVRPDHPAARVLPDPRASGRSSTQRARRPSSSARGADTLVELGSGTSEKTRAAARRLQPTPDRLAPLRALRRVRGLPARRRGHDRRRYPGLDVHGVVGDFERHLG